MSRVASIAMVVVVIVLTIAVVVGVVYGVLSHTEPGLMQETPGFTAVDLPIEVRVMAYSEEIGMAPQDEHDAALRATSRAVDAINDRLGFVALAVQTLPSMTHTHIGVEIGVPSEHAPADGVIVDRGGAAIFHAGGRECYVTTTNTGSDELLQLVLQHELGHCLGLDHDCWSGSIMCGGSCCTIGSTRAGQYPPRIDDSDRALLRHVFGEP